MNFQMPRGHRSSFRLAVCVKRTHKRQEEEDSEENQISDYNAL